MTDQDRFQSSDNLIDKIRKLELPIKALIDQLEPALIAAEDREPNPRRRSRTYWVLAAYRNSLVRSRIFLEQNFHYIEPMGLLAVTRYLFELMVWLKLLERDHQYGLVYYFELLINQLDYYEQLRDQLMREVVFLKGVDAQEDQLFQERLRSRSSWRTCMSRRRRLCGSVVRSCE